MTKPLDRIDAQLVEELRANARTPLATLGVRVHLSRNAVRQRIERLERDGYIGGYTIVEGERAGAPTTNAYLLVYRVDRMRGDDVIAFLRGVPEIVLCDVLSGDFDLLIRVEAESAQRVQRIWQEIANHPGVRDTTTALSLSTEFSRPAPANG